MFCNREFFARVKRYRRKYFDVYYVATVAFLEMILKNGLFMLKTMKLYYETLFISYNFCELYIIYYHLSKHYNRSMNIHDLIIYLH